MVIHPVLRGPQAAGPYGSISVVPDSETCKSLSRCDQAEKMSAVTTVAPSAGSVLALAYPSMDTPGEGLLSHPYTP